MHLDREHSERFLRATAAAASTASAAPPVEQKPEIESMIAEGDRIAVLVRETGIFKSSGRT